jgi:hypothetical protein
MFLREIANLKLALNKKLDEAAVKASQVEKLQKKLNELYEEQIDCGKELQELVGKYFSYSKLFLLRSKFM